MTSSVTIDFLVIFVAGVLGAAGLLVSRRIIPAERVRGHNEAAGFIYATYGVIYAVLIAFVVIAVWETFAKAEEIVSEEASSLISLYRDTTAFPEAEQHALQESLRTYVQSVVDDEWLTMQHGRPSPKTERALAAIWLHYREIDLETSMEVAIVAESFKQLNDVSEERTHRLVASRETLPTVFWPVLVVGGMLCVLFTYFFHTPNVRAHAVMSGMLAAMIAAALYLIVVFDRPFSGDAGVTSISSEAFHHALDVFDDEPAAVH
jgi:uncharacterized membrane protein YraQ (UPF0718 family)